VTQNVPLWLARGMGAMLEGVYGGLRLKGEPRLTRFLVDELSHAHWFDISAARRDLGYVPQVSIDEGLRRLRAWIEDTRGVGAGSERAVSAAS
jgi:nucleoside-diphosphate-sugar epimerase